MVNRDHLDLGQTVVAGMSFSSLADLARRLLSGGPSDEYMSRLLSSATKAMDRRNILLRGFWTEMWGTSPSVQLVRRNRVIHQPNVTSVDVERAADGPFGAPIAHGYLTLSLFIPLFTALLDVEGVSTKVNYGLNKVRFPSPVRVGSRIRLAARLAEVEEVPGGLQITVDGTMEIEGAAKPAAVLQSLSRFYA